MQEIIAANVQGFALGQSEITNYKTLGSVAANIFQKPHCRRGLAQNPLLAAVILSHRSYNCLVTYSVDQSR